MHFGCFLVIFTYILSCNCDTIMQKVFPIKYELTITPHFETELEYSFEASLVFTFKPLHHNTYQTIELYAENLDIESFGLWANNGSIITKLEANIYNDSQQQLIAVDAGYPLSVDKTYQLHFNYSGRIFDNGWGLYKGFYEHVGNKRFYAVTQLRPVFARRLLPCLDEPSYKARFTLRVWRLPQYTARSNMPLVETSVISPKSGRVMDTFAESPSMSTFLLALAVFEFASFTSHGGQFSSWTVPSKIHLAEYGHSMIPAIVGAMESVTGVKFPMPKIDQIALPQLNPVAMENWGMNTYREVFMLYKEGEFAPRVRQDVPRFTAHEVSHHWLGNLVTLEWWGWLWLSEMYAMYYEYYLPSQVRPSWRMADQMVVDLVSPGLLQDSFNTSLPLTTSVSTNQEILDKFSGLTYTKGPALVRMINSFLTIPKAEKALKKLLIKKKFGTVNPTQLWKFYNDEAEGLPTDMESIMRTWTDEPGYPLVTVSVNQSDGVITITQERFLVEGSVKGRTRWWVPLSLTTGARPDFNRTQPKLWLQPGVPLTVLRLGYPVDSWVLANLQQVGFFRVNYDGENWNRLKNALLSKPATIHELSRGQLLDDSFSLARAGRLSYAVPLALASYLSREACYFPWAVVIPNINFIMTRLYGHPVYDVFSGYISQLISPVYETVGFHLDERDSHLEQLQRVQIVSLACSLGLRSCVMAARNHENIISQGKPSQIPPGLETVQLCTVLEAGLQEKNKLHNLSLWSKEDQLKAMPCVANKTAVTEYLTTSLQEDSAADFRVKLTAVLAKLTNVNSVFSTLINNRQTLVERFDDTNVAEYLTLVGKQLTTSDQMEKLKGLRANINRSMILSAVSSTLNELAERLRWVERMGPVIQSWSRAYGKNLTGPYQSSMIACKQ